MKKSELRQIIREEIKKINESSFKGVIKKTFERPEVQKFAIPEAEANKILKLAQKIKNNLYYSHGDSDFLNAIGDPDEAYIDYNAGIIDKKWVVKAKRKVEDVYEKSLQSYNDLLKKALSKNDELKRVHKYITNLPGLAAEYEILKITPKTISINYGSYEGSGKIELKSFERAGITRESFLGVVLSLQNAQNITGYDNGTGGY